MIHGDGFSVKHQSKQFSSGQQAIMKVVAVHVLVSSIRRVVHADDATPFDSPATHGVQF